MRIALLTTIVPNTLRTGSEIATRAILAVLEDLGHEVTLLAYARAPFTVSAPVPSVLLGTIPIETARAPVLARLDWGRRSLRSGLPISSEKYNYLPQASLEAEILRLRPDLLIVDHVNLYPFVGGLIPRLPVGVIFHDVQAHSYAMVAQGAARPWWRAVYAREARLNAGLERRAGGEAAFAWFLSQADAERATRDLGVAAPAVLPLFFPLAVEPASLVPDPAALTPPAPTRHDIGLIGTWTWPPVAQGLDWFLREVVPRLPADLSVAVAGSGSERIRDPRVTALGVVPDARAFHADVRVAAVPTVAGTGIQIKTLELAARGVPAVSTALGVRGLDVVPDNIEVAETPDAFAAALVAAARRPRGHDGVAGAAWNERRRDAARAMIAAALARLAPAASPGEPA